MVRTLISLLGVWFCVHALRRQENNDEPEADVSAGVDPQDAEDYLTCQRLEMDLGKAFQDDQTDEAENSDGDNQSSLLYLSQSDTDDSTASMLLEASLRRKRGGGGRPSPGPSPGPGGGGKGMDLRCGWFGTCRTRTASIHFHYYAPQNAQWYYNQLTPTHTSADTYFAMVTHKYGYAGIQTASRRFGSGTYHQVICSTWDQPGGKARTTKCGGGVKCDGFGGEGTGARAIWQFKWKLNRRYAFLVRRRQVGSLIENTCWFHAAELSGRNPGGWKHISTVTSGSQGLAFTGPGAFLEQWTYKKSNEKRQGTYGPPFFSTSSSGGNWQQVSSGRFSSFVLQSRVKAGLVTKDYISAGTASTGAWMATGGTVMAGAEARSERSLQMSNVGVPSALSQFDSNRQRLLQAAR
eukprot:TRINITY_DN5271_c0_g1_i1.p1 TRINITY_DN5271_c0_g1~~TRINITY_DN5271_c0_g1_i1.p1  ORF type:complete len:408 (-),score=32.04 TRINITY_DN5271_c0_g1_i1:163-1386(-)